MLLVPLLRFGCLSFVVIRVCFAWGAWFLREFLLLGLFCVVRFWIAWLALASVGFAIRVCLLNLGSRYFELAL